MDIAPIEMLKALSISAFCGLCVSFIYDVFDVAIFEILSRKNKVVVFILDTLFIFIFTMVFILLLYYFCDGRARGIFLTALLLGAFLYRRVIKKPTNKIIKLLISPIKMLIHLLIDVIKKIIKFLSQSIAKKRTKLYNKGVK
ncbi:MAG: spore cortex biosynthesis protein YabQ [Clostridia bacterium]|nr:spore cortex biosynthesis protein YabQ [Clostridia bacterium]